MRCAKCHGLFLEETAYPSHPDDDPIRLWACVNCGYREDAVMVQNMLRLLSHDEPTTRILAWSCLHDRAVVL